LFALIYAAPVFVMMTFLADRHARPVTMLGGLARPRNPPR
jgi:hypothetical protein